MMSATNSMRFLRWIRILMFAAIALGLPSMNWSVWAKPPLFGLGFTNASGMSLAWIPPGTFMMGSPTNEQQRVENEGPLTEVKLSNGFWLGQYELTQGEWSELMTNNPSTSRGDLRLPVETITWHEASELCRRLTERERAADRLPPGHAYSLPTAAQWEHACRAGTTTRFNYGDDLDYKGLSQQAWYLQNSEDTTHPVGLKKPNEWGLYDMHGNVWEWCSDRSNPYYPGGKVTDPEDSNSEGIRSFRGGGRTSFDRMLRSACRGGDLPATRAMGLGMRVALVSVIPPFSSESEKLSYAVGVIFGLGLRGEGFEIDPEVLARGLRDSFTESKSTRLSDPQARKIMEASRARRTAEAAGQMRAREERLQKAADEFLGANAKREAVTLLDSGLQYEVLQVGLGERPTTNDAVVVHLRGKVIEGLEFEDTYAAKSPKRLIPGVHYVVPGLQEAFLRMPVGSKWRVYLPGRLGFPANHPNPVAAPGSALIYEIELVSKQSREAVMAALREEQLVRNRKMGEDFISNYAKQTGVKSLPSRLYYKEVNATTGRSPKTNDLVEVHWRLSLLDGTELANTFSRGVPMPLQMSEMNKSFRGMFEALSQMSVGSKWQLAVPSELAYGDEGRPPQVQPGSTLLCEVELLEIQSPKSSIQGDR